MNTHELPDQDPELRRLLRESDAAPGLRPGFRAAVWRRIEDGDASPVWSPAALWRLLTGPRWALATLALAMLVGAVLGSQSATDASRHHAQERYVSVIAPWQQR
jgi:hypothetical protein